MPKKISAKITTTNFSGLSFVSSRIKGYLQFAESENARLVLKGIMNNQNAQLERKNSTIQFLKQAKELIEEYPDFLEKGSSLSALYDLSKAASKNFTENNSVKNKECFRFSGGNFGNCFWFYLDLVLMIKPIYPTQSIQLEISQSDSDRVYL